MDTSKKKEILDKSYARAYEFEQKYGCCPQCVVAALQETFGGIDDAVFQSSQALAGGSALAGLGTCGALAGGMVVISAKYGREKARFTEGLPRRAFELSKMLYDEFIEEFGSPTCRGVQEARFGRSFDMWDPLDREQFYAMGGHVDKCPYVAAKVALWTAEILIEAQEDEPS